MKEAGFTLMELMVTIALAVILITVAVPSFIDIIRNNRLATQTNELVTALTLARSEAVKRAARVAVRPWSTATGWTSGWAVTLDLDGDGDFTDEDLESDAGVAAVLRKFEAPGNDGTLGISPTFTAVVFNPDGSLNVRVSLGDAYNAQTELQFSLSFHGRCDNRITVSLPGHIKHEGVANAGGAVCT